MRRLTEVSHDQKQSGDHTVELEPFHAEVTNEEAAQRPVILPPGQSTLRLPAVLKRVRRARTARAKFHAALDAVRASASLLPAAGEAGNTFRYRMKAFVGKLLFSIYIVGVLLLSPFLIAEIVPNGSPTATLLCLGGALLYTLILFRLSRLPEKLICRSIDSLDYARALRILADAERFGFAAFVPRRADVLLDTGKFAEAEQWIRSGLIGRSPKRDKTDLYRYARALAGLGQNELAEKLFFHSAEILPGGDALNGYADMILKRRGSPLDVLELLDMSLKRTEEKTPEFLILHNTRIAWALSRMNEIEEADRLLAKAFENFATLKQGLQARLLLFRSEILFDRGKRAEAAAAAKSCIALDPEGPTHGDARLVLVAASLRVSEHRQHAAAAENLRM